MKNTMTHKLIKKFFIVADTDNSKVKTSFVMYIPVPKKGYKIIEASEELFNAIQKQQPNTKYIVNDGFADVSDSAAIVEWKPGCEPKE